MRSTAIAVILAFQLMMVANTGWAASEVPGLAVETVLDAVQDGLADAQGRLATDSLPPLKSVELVLETTATRKVGGGLSIWVISIGAKYEKESASTLTIELTPPVPAPQSVAADDVAKALSDMIVEAAVGTHKMRDAPTPLRLARVAAALKFVVTKSGEAGGKFTIAPVTIDLAGGLANKAVQTIKVTFAERETR